MTITESPSFKLGKLILSKHGEFTLTEVIQDLNDQGMSAFEESTLKIALKRLRDNGLLVQHGNSYTVAL